MVPSNHRGTMLPLCCVHLKVVVYLFYQPRLLSGLRRSLVHLLMIARHCVQRQGSNSGQGGEGFNFLAGMVSICLIL